MAGGQSGPARRLLPLVSVGLHLGDLIVDGDDLHGDGVNVAALRRGTRQVASWSRGPFTRQFPAG
jgi:hypothetical protein